MRIRHDLGKFRVIPDRPQIAIQPRVSKPRRIVVTIFGQKSADDQVLRYHVHARFT